MEEAHSLLGAAQDLREEAQVLHGRHKVWWESKGGRMYSDGKEGPNAEKGTEEPPGGPERGGLS